MYKNDSIFDLVTLLIDIEYYKIKSSVIIWINK